MAFNISEFKTVINRYGGPARKNLFEVSLNVLDARTGRSDHTFFCKSVTVPGINLTVQDYRPNGFGLMQTIPTAISPDQLNCVFILDSQHIMLSFFHRWIQKVVNYDVSGGIFSQVDDQLPYEFGYKDEYVTRMTIRHYSTDYNGFYEYTFEDVFPTQVSGTDLSWEDNDSYSTVTINFAYSSMKVDGTRVGSPTDRFARGTGLVDFINRLGNSGQFINQNSLPTTVQTAIDNFTQIRSSVSILRSLFK
jgi:hypothetical protein